MGGGYSLGLALGEPRLAATVINYGRLVLDPKAIAAIRSPILGNFGGQDRGIPADEVKKFDQRLWVPPKGVVPPKGSPWSAEAETAAFKSFASAFKATGAGAAGPAIP